MALKPWYTLVTPREDLREGRPLDASEFAVHLDQVRDGRAPRVYQDPAQFFERTYLTQGLKSLAVEVVRRLAGIKVETSAVFNMTTQFGGGKTHALTLLYHLATGGPEASRWKGVRAILDEAGITEVPRAAVAVFVGTEFDSIRGRGGDDGTPVRKTPWGEIAWQLRGEEGFEIVREHEEKQTAPGGDVIDQLLPADRPVLILLDELLNYVNRTRNLPLSGQLHSFLQNLSEVARSRDNVVLAVSIPASELEMTPEDQSDFDRLKKLLDRVGKAVFMSARGDTAEIIRRRLFEWVGLPDEAKRTVEAYANWIVENRSQLPQWFPVDNATDELRKTYPLHPSVLSVFERKWQILPRFQQTRGVLRLLALWVSKAYSDGFQGAHKDPLITLGTAPLDDPLFRAAAFEQLGETRLEAAVTTDIAGKESSHAIRLDEEAVDTIKKARLHRKVATTIFFESNGGQQRTVATLPEIRLAVGGPDVDIGNIEQCLEALAETCYYLAVEQNAYRFSFQPNLNKLLADRRATIRDTEINDRLRADVQAVFKAGRRVERVFFPERTNQVPDRPALTFVILPPEMDRRDASTLAFVEQICREAGSSARTYKSALIWCVPEDRSALAEAARKVLAWEAIAAEAEELKLDDAQRRQLNESLQRAQRDLREAIWRSYKNVYLLDASNKLRHIDLGLINSSAASSLVDLIIARLQEEDVVADHVSPNFLARNWPPAIEEWSTKGVRDAFFASPQFPRLLEPEAIKRTIARGVEEGFFGYAGKDRDGRYEPFYFKTALPSEEIEISADMYLIPRELAAQIASGEEQPPPPSRRSRPNLRVPALLALNIRVRPRCPGSGGKVSFRRRNGPSSTRRSSRPW